MSKFLCIEYKQNLILQKRTALFGCRTGLKKLFEKNFFLLDVSLFCLWSRTLLSKELRSSRDFIHYKIYLKLIITIPKKLRGCTWYDAQNAALSKAFTEIITIMRTKMLPRLVFWLPEWSGPRR